MVEWKKKFTSSILKDFEYAKSLPRGSLFFSGCGKRGMHKKMPHSFKDRYLCIKHNVEARTPDRFPFQAAVNLACIRKCLRGSYSGEISSRLAELKEFSVIGRTYP